MAASITLNELPQESSPDYFRILVRNCIETYKKLPNDAMCLDYNKVSGKLRAMILDDDEYKKETRNIYAQQQLEAISEIDYLASLASSSADDDNDDPRSRGKKKKVSGADKDMLNMRFKAAQMKRELIAAMNNDNAGSETDIIHLLWVPITAEELAQYRTTEVNAGGNEDGLAELTNSKEEMPEGTGGKIRTKGQTESLEDEDFFDINPETGEITERD
jgi:hypothetical protein